MKTGGGGADVLEKIVHMEPNLKTIVFGRKYKNWVKRQIQKGEGSDDQFESVSNRERKVKITLLLTALYFVLQ